MLHRLQLPVADIEQYSDGSFQSVSLRLGNQTTVDTAAGTVSILLAQHRLNGDINILRLVYSTKAKLISSSSSCRVRLVAPLGAIGPDRFKHIDDADDDDVGFSTMEFSPNDDALAIRIHQHCQLVIFERESGTIPDRITGREEWRRVNTSPDLAWRGSPSLIGTRAMCFSPDSKFLAVSQGASVFLLETVNYTKVAQVNITGGLDDEESPSEVCAVSFSADARQLFVVDTRCNLDVFGVSAISTAGGNTALSAKTKRKLVATQVGSYSVDCEEPAFAQVLQRRRSDVPSPNVFFDPRDGGLNIQLYPEDVDLFSPTDLNRSNSGNIARYNTLFGLPLPSVREPARTRGNILLVPVVNSVATASETKCDGNYDEDAQAVGIASEAQKQHILTLEETPFVDSRYFGFYVVDAAVGATQTKSEVHLRGLEHQLPDCRTGMFLDHVSKCGRFVVVHERRKYPETQRVVRLTQILLAIL